LLRSTQIEIPVNVASTPSVQAATSAAQGSSADAVNLMVLRKALDMQAVSAMTLLQAVTPMPALATSGNLGTKLNAFA
jgi:hypothetical protein